MIVLTIAGSEDPTRGLDSASFTDGIAASSSLESGLDTKLGGSNKVEH